jgi:hypothetical protein
MKPAIRLAFTTMVIIGAAAFIGAPVHAQPFIDAVLKNCSKELKTYCSKVKQGEGRLAFCLFAHEDKLSPRCDSSVFYAANELAKILSARAAVVSVCEPDARRLCPGVKSGDGNILFCLNKAQKALSPGCNQAIADAKLR